MTDVASRLRRSAGRTVDSIRRGFDHAGAERETLLLIAKSAVAATIAWLIADSVLHAPSPTFAPFSALLMVQVTIAQSLYQSLRHATAVVLGVALTGAAFWLLGVTIWTFVVLLLIALAIGRWPRLGSQGSQVAVAALFAYAAMATASSPPESYIQLFSIAGLVVMGSTIGVLTNVLVVPPLRYRSAHYAVGTLSQSLSTLLSDIRDGLLDGVPDPDDSDEWRRRACRLPGSVAQARSTVEHTAEAMRFNPRKLIMRDDDTFDGYRAIINALQRASEQLTSITTGLCYAAEQDDTAATEQVTFLRDYASLLDAIADASATLGDLHTVADIRDDDRLDHYISRACARYDALVADVDIHDLDPPTQWPIYSALHTDGHRVVQEFIQVQQELTRLVRTAAPGGRTVDRDSRSGRSAPTAPEVTGR